MPSTQVQPFDHQDSASVSGGLESRPTEVCAAPKGSKRTSRRWHGAAGYAYLACTIAGSLRFASLVHESARNDYYWPGFNTTSTQTFLADAYNRQLALVVQDETVLSLDSSAATAKDYSSRDTVMDLNPSRGRTMLLSPLPFLDVILAMRKADVTMNLIIKSPFCWVDFNRSFELAQTAARQQRCNNDQTKTTNAALYLDAILRNFDYRVATESFFFPWLNSSVLSAVAMSPTGQAWTDTYKTRAVLSPSDEAAHWKHVVGLTLWVSQLTNRIQVGIEDTISIVSALGRPETIKINGASYLSRYMSQTTDKASMGFTMELAMCATMLQCSVVRGAPNHVEAIGMSWDMFITMGTPSSVSSRVIRQAIGPFGAIDIKLHVPPASVKLFVASFQRDLSAALTSDRETLAKYRAFPPPVGATPTPHEWTNAGYTFYGGNPMCMNGRPQTFVQASFGFYDACGIQEVLTVQLDADAVLMAYVAMLGDHQPTAPPPFVGQACALTGQLATLCLDALHAARAIHDAVGTHWSVTTKHHGKAAWDDLSQLNMTLLQFATDGNSSDVLLVKPWISHPDDAWSFYGWAATYEWVQGKREVYTFEGDAGKYTMISPGRGLDALAANPLELPQNACNYVRYINIYVTFALTGIAVLVVLYGAVAKFRIGGAHLFQFNRVVGSVWIGRPFLLLRGMTAVVMLSTAHVALVSSSGLTYLQQQPRALVDVALLAGEATWIAYVIVDFFLPLTRSLPRVYSPLGSVMAWLAVIALELASPITPVAIAHTKCVLISVDTQVRCDNGSFEIGSVHRVGYICLIQVCAVALAYLGAGVAAWLKPSPRDMAQHHLLIPVASQMYLAEESGGGLSLDHIGCVMSGILPLRAVFDIKLWGVFRLEKYRQQNDADVQTLLEFPNPTFRDLPPPLAQLDTTTMTRPKYRQWIAVLGLIYMAASVGASYLYLELTASTMANDFWWTGYNVTGPQSFLCNWYIRNLAGTTETNRGIVWSGRIDDPKHGDVTEMYNTTKSKIMTTSQYAVRIQDDINTLENVIAGLRQMDGCDVPWIFTAYCYVDFDKRWEMANSLRKQRQCRESSTTSNGAVFLESILRNADLGQLEQCWGRALQSAVFDAVQATSDGQAWVDRVRRGQQMNLQDEALHWRGHSITHYTTQWQNFKMLGVHDVFSIQNALGIRYTMTLRHSKSVIDTPAQTSFKMYWGLANDLMAVADDNTTTTRLPGRGMSLVRQSAKFAFQNQSLEQSLIARGHLMFPLSPDMAAVRDMLGPFGSIDVLRVPVPASLATLHRSLTQTVASVLADDMVDKLFNYSAISVFQNYFVLPAVWNTGELFLGGRILGGKSGHQAPSPFDTGILAIMPVYGSRASLLMAALASGFHLQGDSSTARASTCAIEVQAPRQCERDLATLAALARHFHLPSFASDARLVQRDITDVVQLLVVQFLGDPTRFTTRLSQLPVFSDPQLEYFVWLVLFQWVAGDLDVVRLQGLTSITTLSMSITPWMTFVDPLEVPVNVSYYIRCCIHYVTYLLLLVALLTGCTIIAVRGHIENWNMLQINRVAGIVWIGRPLVLLRAVTAICLLSTPPLELTLSPNGLVTYFTSPPRFWLTTVMSCGEMSWLVYIINDIMSPLTRQYTALYARWCSLLVWAVTCAWTLAQPVYHQVQLGRTCTVAAVDFDVACHSGTVEIGRFSRFLTLIALTIACCLVCYLYQRLRHPSLQAPARQTSLFLHAVARHHLTFRNLQYQGVEYLDKASAILSGLLCVHVGGVLFVFDIKSWRPYVILTAHLPDTSTSPNHQALDGALPLLE